MICDATIDSFTGKHRTARTRPTVNLIGRRMTIEEGREHARTSDTPRWFTATSQRMEESIQRRLPRDSPVHIVDGSSFAAARRVINDVCQHGGLRCGSGIRFQFQPLYLIDNLDIVDQGATALRWGFACRVESERMADVVALTVTKQLLTGDVHLSVDLHQEAGISPNAIMSRYVRRRRYRLFLRRVAEHTQRQVATWA